MRKKKEEGVLEREKRKIDIEIVRQSKGGIDREMERQREREEKEKRKRVRKRRGRKKLGAQ